MVFLALQHVNLVIFLSGFSQNFSDYLISVSISGKKAVLAQCDKSPEERPTT